MGHDFRGFFKGNLVFEVANPSIDGDEDGLLHAVRYDLWTIGGGRECESISGLGVRWRLGI